MSDQKITATIGAKTEEFDSTLNGLTGKLKNISVAWGAAMATGGAVITKVLQGVSDAFLDTTIGVKMATAAQELWAQSTYNLATGMVNFNKTMYESLKIAQYMVWLRQDNRKDLIEEARLQKEFNQLYFESVDRGKSDAERIKIMNEAIKVNNSLYDTRIINLKEELKLVQAQLVMRPKSNKLLDAEAKIQAELIQVDGERFTGMRRLQSQMTSLQEQIKSENLKKYLDWIDEQNKKTDEAAEAAERAAEAFKKLKESYTPLYTRGFRGDSLYGAVQEKVIGGGLARGGKDLAGPPTASTESMEDMTKALRMQDEAVNILSDGFMSLFSSTENGFKAMADAFIASIERIAAVMLAKAAVFGILSLLSGGGSMGASKLLGGKSFWNFITPFASGGMVFGPQLALVGENSSRSNPEVIAPLDKLMGMMGGQSVNVHVSGEIDGRNIKLVQRRSGIRG